MRNKGKSIQASLPSFLKEYWKTILLILALSLIMRGSVHAAQHVLLQQGIAEEVLRFHVLANSDSDEDQRVKYLVRDAVLEYLWDKMEDAETGESFEQQVGSGTENVNEAQTRSENQGISGHAEAWAVSEHQEISGNAETGTSLENPESSGRAQMKEFLQNNLREIERVSDQVLSEQGMSYSAETALETVWFPNRTYGDCTFPAGWYEALRVKLGKADGHNWWCVLYPRLCFYDSVHAVVEEDQKKELEEVLTVEEYEELLKKPARWKISFRWF